MGRCFFLAAAASAPHNHPRCDPVTTHAVTTRNLPQPPTTTHAVTTHNHPHAALRCILS